jgi:hypothetical protein
MLFRIGNIGWAFYQSVRPDIVTKGMENRVKKNALYKADHRFKNWTHDYDRLTTFLHNNE